MGALRKSILNCAKSVQGEALQEEPTLAVSIPLFYRRQHARYRFLKNA